MNEEMLLRDILNDLAEIVAVPSVYSTPAPNAPYGKPCRAALDWFVKKSREYGLKAELIGGACAYAETGEGDECIGILGHLDVVPAGNGWATDPFKMVEENGKVYGRGVGDDKGAVVVCLHALRTLAANKTPLRRRVRLIVGADEERGSSCIRAYLESGAEVPVMSFVPDSEFPVINSEKGIGHVRFIFDDPALAANIEYIDGAECFNAVPDRSRLKIIGGSPLGTALEAKCGGAPTAEVFKSSPLAEQIVSAGNGFSDYEITNGKCVEITANGTAEHASTPEKGDNALWKSLGLLAAMNGVIGSKYIEGIYEYLCTPLASGKLGIYVDDPKTGDTTMCMSQARMNGGKLELLIDFRLPLGQTAADVAAAICGKLGCTAEILDYRENLYVDEDTLLVRTLLDVYRGITNDMTPPLKMGGGTYARELPNAVAFGCTPVDLEINMHRADENFPIAQLMKNYEIYLEAAKRLANAK
ncbi:MAG: Sapep family Mn(2+)-dependent dipeptidase [Clostridia bacterium]|nr:Sapep family Mn(2+)-dependent dipeptidase [Clostridia bacterium]